MSEWKEIHARTPPEVAEIPDHCYGYEAWETDELYIEMFADDVEGEYYNVLFDFRTSNEPEPEVLGNHPNYEQAKEQLEDAKEEY